MSDTLRAAAEEALVFQAAQAEIEREDKNRVRSKEEILGDLEDFRRELDDNPSVNPANIHQRLQNQIRTKQLEVLIDIRDMLDYKNQILAAQNESIEYVPFSSVAEMPIQPCQHLNACLTEDGWRCPQCGASVTYGSGAPNSSREEE